MKKVICFFCLLILFGFKHPFYLSVTELKYNHKQMVMEGSVKLFTNDLETALQKLSGKKVDLINSKNTAEIAGLLSDYILKRLIIKVEGKIVKYKYLGYEREQEATWIYFESQKCNKPKQIILENSLLYDFIKEQMNIVHTEVDGQKRSLKVTNPEKVLKFDFK